MTFANQFQRRASENIPTVHGFVPKFAIGIDPGLVTGMALYELRPRRLVEVWSTDFWGAYRWITSGYQQCTTLVVVENSALNKFTYRQRTVGARSGVAERMSRNVGSNNRESVLLIEGLRLAGYVVQEIQPTSGQGKLNAEQFKRVTKWEKSTNQHGRDAAMLVFGR